MTRRPDEPRFANLRSGDMAQCNEPEPRGIGWRFLVICALGFFIATFGLVLIAGEVPEYTPSEKFINCFETGC